MSIEGGLTLQITENPDAIVVRLVAPKILNDQTFQAMIEEFFVIASRLKDRVLRLDFGVVTYLQSSALGKLIALNSRVNALGSRMILCNIQPSVFKVIAATKLNLILTIEKAPEPNDAPAP